MWMFFLALPFAFYFLLLGWKHRKTSPFFRGLILTSLALLPILHVIHNAGGQWYLLLPSLGVAYCWGGHYQSIPRKKKRRHLFCIHCYHRSGNPGRKLGMERSLISNR
jgi:hypothetical protein